MVSRTSRLTLAILAVVGLAIVVPVDNASAATVSPSINTVTCDHSDYTAIGWGVEGAPTEFTCFANAGVVALDCGGKPCVLHYLWAGNNRVSYRHQDGNVITWMTVEKYDYRWPGVEVNAIRIL